MRLISILLGSRGRPQMLRKMWTSFYEKAHEKFLVEAVVYADKDDPETIQECQHLSNEFADNFTYVCGPRMEIMSQMTNICYTHCDGDIILMGADDLECRTPNWDNIVREVFNTYTDRVALVYGSDGHWGSAFATHPFQSREAIEVLGEVCDGRYHHAMADRALWDIYTTLGRTHFAPIITYHTHHDYGERPVDSTDKYQKENFRKYRPDLLYLKSSAEIQEKANKLRNYIESHTCAS